MEQQKHITKGLQLEPVLKTSKVHSLQPRQPRLSCNYICSFSNETYSRVDLAERSKSTMKLRMLIMFCVVVMAVEIVGGLKSNSLAVLTDAVHLLSDIAGFAISLFTVWVSGWEATSRQSFGFNRLEVLGALLSVQLIWMISGILIYEAIERLLHPNEKVNGKLMFAISAFGFVINLIMAVLLGHDHSHHCHSHDHALEMEELTAQDREENTSLVSSSPSCSRILNINIQGAYLHIVTDLIQSVGVMIAGSIMWSKPDWLIVDLLCTLVFSIIALTATLPMLKSIFCILMERTPHELDIVSLENGLKHMSGLDSVQDLHVWAITAGKFVLVCHVVIEPGANPKEVLHNIRQYCEKKFRIHHVTIQIEEKLQ